MPDPRTDRKFRKPKPEEQDLTEEEAQHFFVLRLPARPVSQPSPASTLPGSACEARAKAANSFALRKYGRTREEIDRFITEHYRSRGPTWVGQQLDMKVTTVIMRARRLGL